MVDKREIWQSLSGSAFKWSNSIFGKSVGKLKLNFKADKGNAKIRHL